MRDRAFTSLVGFVSAVAFSTPSSLDAQGAVAFPRPDSSRAPLLTRAPADSIRYQTAYLHVAELLQALQAGDAPLTSALLEHATLSSTPCGSVSETVSRVGTRVRRIALSSGGTSLALFFNRIEIVDSGTVQVVTGELVLVPVTSKVLIRSSVRLVLDAEQAVWTKEGGLLGALCEA
jgi:hypothetical protein